MIPRQGSCLPLFAGLGQCLHEGGGAHAVHPQMRWAVELRGQSRSSDTVWPRTAGLGGAVPGSECGTAEIRPRRRMSEGVVKDEQGLV